MPKAKIFSLLGAVLLIFPGTVGANLPITVLGESADVVVIAVAQSIREDSTGSVRAQLQPVVVIKGQRPVSGTIVTFPASSFMRQFAAEREIPTSSGTVGLWFLKQEGDGTYLVLPTEGGSDYSLRAAFLPLPTWWSPSPSADLNQNLLSALSAWYQSTLKPGPSDDGRLFMSLENADRNEAFSVVNELLESALIDHRLIGLAAGIRMGSDEALQRLVRDVEIMRFQEKFKRITEALGTYYREQSRSAVAALSQLIALRSDAPGLDLAVVRALGRIGQTPYTPVGGPGPAVPAGPGTPTKQTLPLFVQLLDSRDPAAQRGAASLLGQFAVLANPDGEIIQGISSAHPFRSEDTMRYTPRNDSNISVAEYVSFWKSWWAQNRAKLGFPAEPGQ